MIKSLRRLTRFSSIAEVSRFAIDIIEAWNVLSKDRLLNRKRVVFELKAGANTVPHGLGYEPDGYIIVTRSAAISHYLVSKSETNLVINSSVAAFVTLEVY